MRKTLSVACTLVVLLFSLYACQKQTISGTEDDPVVSPADFPTSEECGVPITKDLFDQGNIADRGDLQIGNTADGIVLWVSASGEVGGPDRVKRIIATYGSHEHVLNVMNETVLWTPCMGPANPDRVKESAPNSTQDSIHIPNSAFQSSDSCVWLSLNITLTDATGFEWCVFPSPYDDSIVGISVWKVLIKYCKQDCEGNDCGQLRTQTQGGWGAPPNGNNSGMYLHNNFAAAFPTGLTVGCAGGYTVKYTSAGAITEFLPAGGEPGVLEANAVNPADNSIKNVLIGQVTALALSVAFDKHDANFGEGDNLLGDMYINEGPFQGMTVNQFLVIANDVLGGCNTTYTAKDVNDVADKINNNYVDGKRNNGYLVCEL